ncbi:MAG TPA: YqgE/AlgH family protein [Candidatus Binataceae bacterium]|nr:YqgE/AlgH family protein [Candidatus Binataceae bacterium]
MKSRSLLIITLALIGSVIVPSHAIAQGEQFGDKPYFLVARDDMSDPTFQQTVILMIPAPPQAAIVAGVIINKPTKARLDQLFTQVPHLNHPEQTVYFGGPVEYETPLLMEREDPGSDSTRLMGDLYATADMNVIMKTLSHEWSVKDCRIYFGRAQWTPDQLRGEIVQGAWDVAPAKPELIFADDPDRTWRSLVKESHERQVRLDEGAGRSFELAFAPRL